MNATATVYKVAQPPRRVLYIEDMVSLFKVHSRTVIHRLVKERGLPKPVRAGRTVFWINDEVQAWIHQERQLGHKLPHGRRQQKPRLVIPKPYRPRLYKENGAWCIKGRNGIIYKGETPKRCYKNWSKWGGL